MDIMDGLFVRLYILGPVRFVSALVATSKVVEPVSSSIIIMPQWETHLGHAFHRFAVDGGVFVVQMHS